MPPKKSQTKPSKTRASEKCHHHNRGYCKSKDECENKHSEDICEDIDCIEEKCEKRHPYECKFGIRCRFRKNNECMYLHATLVSDDGKFQALKKQLENKLTSLENNIAKMEKIQAEKDAAIKSLNGKCEKFEKSLVSMEHFKEHLENKTSIINGLEIKLEELEQFNQQELNYLPVR